MSNVSEVNIYWTLRHAGVSRSPPDKTSLIRRQPAVQCVGAMKVTIHLPEDISAALEGRWDRRAEALSRGHCRRGLSNRCVDRDSRPSPAWTRHTLSGP